MPYRWIQLLISVVLAYTHSGVWRDFESPQRGFGDLRPGKRSVRLGMRQSSDGECVMRGRYSKVIPKCRILRIGVGSRIDDPGHAGSGIFERQCIRVGMHIIHCAMSTGIDKE